MVREEKGVTKVKGEDNLDFILFALKHTHVAIEFGFTKNECRRNLDTALQQYWQTKEMRRSGIIRSQKEKIPKSKSAKTTNGKIQVEHVVPRKVIMDLLLEIPKPKKKNVRDTLEKFYRVCRVTVEEHKRLSSVGLRSEMPDNWNGSDLFARYEVANIDIDSNDFD